MEINNNPALQVLPTLVGEINASRKNRQSIEPIGDRQSSDQSPSLVRNINESEKQSARQEFESNLEQNKDQPIFKENQPANRAIQAYLDNNESEQKDYLSDVLGIDVRV